MKRKRMTTGKKLRGAWSIPAMRVYFHQDGDFYEVPIEFPAALCDMNGCILFKSREEMTVTRGVSVTSKVHIPDGISSLDGYKKSNLPIPIG